MFTMFDKNIPSFE